jgi:hypothetical protein
MSVAGDAPMRRVLVPQALGADEFLRVTWHESRKVIVFSHWQGDHCVAATPVRVSDIAELAELTVAALASTMPAPPLDDLTAPVWPAPDAADVVLIDLSA